MATRINYKREEITSGNRGFSQSRTTIETAFYGNNVEIMNDLKKAYKMAEAAPEFSGALRAERRRNCILGNFQFPSAQARGPAKAVRPPGEGHLGGSGNAGKMVLRELPDGL